MESSPLPLSMNTSIYWVAHEAWWQWAFSLMIVCSSLHFSTTQNFGKNGKFHMKKLVINSYKCDCDCVVWLCSRHLHPIYAFVSEIFDVDSNNRFGLHKCQPDLDSSRCIISYFEMYIFASRLRKCVQVEENALPCLQLKWLKYQCTLKACVDCVCVCVCVSLLVSIILMLVAFIV